MIDWTKTPTVLVVDDEKNIRQSLEIVLSQEDMQVVLAHDVPSAVRAINERPVDILILDIQLGEVDGLTFYKKLLADGHHIPTIFISGHATLSEAAQAVKIGGYDFVEKPFSADKIVITVKRCLEYSSLSARLRNFESRRQDDTIVGDSPQINALLADVNKVATTNASVLISGESGTGKELVANALHDRSPRRAQSFIKVNCSAIPDNLIESELFGHERGSFTGAVTAKRGLFELAHRGTIFLDEVADLSLSAQAKILRVLQSGEIQKVGSEKTTKVDVRIISGTHKNLKEAVNSGLFREDLYYRFNVVPLKVPSLRDRPDDIPLLVKFFSKKIADKNNLKEKTIDEDVVWDLKKYSWPGNVRELQNVLERVLIMSGPRITAGDLPDEILAPSDTNSTANPQLSSSALKDFRNKVEREFIVNALKAADGNVSQTATALGVGRTYLHKRMLVLDITKRDYFA